MHGRRPALKRLEHACKQSDTVDRMEQVCMRASSHVKGETEAHAGVPLSAMAPSETY